VTVFYFRSMQPPGIETTLMHWPWVVIRLRCTGCEREDDVRLAACAARFGTRATMAEVLGAWRAKCPWAPGDAWKPRKYGHRCGGYLPDVFRAGPPDLPPSMTGLRVINGDREKQQPVKEGTTRRRRRVGE